MWADDTPDHPMTALFEVAYSGCLDRAMFESALRRALREHPLLQSIVETDGKRPCWRTIEDAAPPVFWDREHEPLHYPGGSEYLELTREIGLRVWVRSGSIAGRVVFQIHHACADGLGVTNFVFDVFRAYAHLAGDPIAPPERNATLLKSRDRFYRRPLVGRLRMLVWAGLHMVTWLGSRPVSLATRAVQPSPQAPMETIRYQILERSEMELLLAVAHAEDVTLNDLLLRDLFAVLADRRGDCAAGDECLCLCMPVNLRTPSDAHMPATNKMTMTFLRRSLKDCAIAKSLLQNIRQETTGIKRSRRGLRLIEVLRFALALRGKVPQRLLAKSSYATAVLSNLGRIGGCETGLPTDEDGRLCCGDVTIDRVVTAPNARPGTAVVIVVLTYAGQLTLSLRFDPTVLAPDDADGLLEDYVRQLRLTAAENRLPCAVG